MINKYTGQTRRSDWASTSETLSELSAGDYDHLISEVMPQRYPKSWRDRPLIPAGSVREVVDRMAVHYLRPPQRVWDLPDSLQALWRANLRATGFDSAMRSAERILASHQTAILYLRRTGAASARWIALPPHSVEIDLGMGVDVQGADRVALTVPAYATHQSTSVQTDTWTPTEFASGKTKVANPYPSIQMAEASVRYPVVVITAVPPASGDWAAPLPDQLLHLDLESTLAISDAVYVGSYNSWGQRFLTAAEQGQPEAMHWGPDVIVGLAEGQTLGTSANPSPALGQYVQAAEYAGDIARRSLGMPGKSEERGVTGSAKAIARTDGTLARERFRAALEDGERQAYDVMRAHLAWDYGISRDVTPFAPPTISYWTDKSTEVADAGVDPLHRAQAAQLRIQLGLASAAEIMAEERGITVEEAEAIVASRRASGVSQDG